jgi:serine/threonine-protein kinase
MDQLARDHPEMTKYQLGLGVMLGRLGHTCAWERMFPQAEAAVRRSIAILEKLAADHPQDMRVASELGYAYLCMQTVAHFRGDEKSSLEWLDRCIQVYRVLARRDPRNRWIGRRRLWEALAERGESRTRLGRLPEALADFQETIELAHDTGNKNEEIFRAFHALTKARLGDLSELALLGDQVRDILRAGTGQNVATIYDYYMLYYDAACAHAALAQLAVRDQGRSPAGRQRLADRDLERALDLLDKARSSGEFKEMIRLDEIRRERLLDPLRSDRRFQDLMLDLAFPESPFQP